MTAEVNVLIALGLLTIAAGLAIGGWMLVRAAPVGGRDRISYRSEAPQVFRRSYAGCGSRLRVA